MKTACAIMAVYNEADVVREAVTKLIEQGVDVYLIDNASTDGTADVVSDLVGRGVVDIETARFHENGREVYDWTALLRMKEQLSRRLGHDWYLHVDADEIRYAPWPELSLREGLDRVDGAGYNLVNFKLFNFRLTADTRVCGDFESSMTLYSSIERFNQRQVKAWKAHPDVDIASLGGHHIRVPGGRVFPTRFIHKHYPVRSLEHGRRKILAERKARFSDAERARGWHVQYDHLADVDSKDVFWDPAALVAFDFACESHALFVESNSVLTESFGEGGEPVNDANFVNRWTLRLTQAGVDPQHATQLIAAAGRIAQLLSQQDLPPIAATPDDAIALRRIIASFARMRYLDGDPSLYGRLPQLRFR
ncbi:glycosyltransferase family 2 protein [Roseateles violae]|uniref:Glycosyltransferase family 2 protein n=1 Tax=Roseateles violae TaxID=3058042 RepID=A0ABT8DU03_9BURK|nr:glycosyltransferase family 2 protein [Pelomonas sp. PFR6]MDN3921774.1 glycosyltransferase family 2 protein [Pelomonas sp. PFR6]